MRRLTPMLAAAAAVCAFGGLTRPALAQAASLIGPWTGQWDNIYFVEYNITRATRKSLSGIYGYKMTDGRMIHAPFSCTALSATEYNCGASSLTITSPESISAVMHAQNGHTAYATLTH